MTKTWAHIFPQNTKMTNKYTKWLSLVKRKCKSKPRYSYTHFRMSKISRVATLNDRKVQRIWALTTENRDCREIWQVLQLTMQPQYNQKWYFWASTQGIKPFTQKRVYNIYVRFILKNFKVETTQCSPRGNGLYWYEPTLDPGQ